MTLPATALGDSAVCTTCGTVHWADQVCPNCRTRADLQAQIDDLLRENAAQRRAWELWREGDAAACGGVPVPQPRRPRSTRPRPSRPRPGAPSLSLVTPGGAG